MSTCPFCNATEQQETPLCQSCGAMRYPVSEKATHPSNKLIVSAAVAVAILTPGSFVVLALVGANKLNTKLKAIRR